MKWATRTSADVSLPLAGFSVMIKSVTEPGRACPLSAPSCGRRLIVIANSGLCPGTRAPAMSCGIIPCVTVNTGTVALIEQFGKFTKIAKPGLNVVIPCFCEFPAATVT